MTNRHRRRSPLTRAPATTARTTPTATGARTAPGAPTAIPTTTPTATTTAALGPRHADPAPQRLSPARASVLRDLVAAGAPVTVTALAAGLRQHPNTVREHLDALVADRRVERIRSRPEGRGRPAWLYCAVDQPVVTSTKGLGPEALSAGQEYVALAAALLDQVASTSPNPGQVAEQAGERWGRSLAEQRAGRHAAPAENAATSAADSPGPGAPDRSAAGVSAPPCDPSQAVVEILDDLRFSPEPSPKKDVLRLTTCPILDAARHNPDVVCQVHLGIVRGALAQLGGDPDSADLTAFAEPGACLLTLRDRQ